MFTLKKFFSFALVSGMCVFAARAHAVGSAGCGLGSLVFLDNVWWKQVMAATTNGISANQTFGITFGTSNCGPGLLGQVQKQEEFVAANLSSLQREAVQGVGETIHGYASLMGCPSSAYENFGASLQEKYDVLFYSEDPRLIVDKTKSEFLNHPHLAQVCEHLRAH